MNYPIDQLQGDSRIWLFFATRNFTDQEASLIINSTSEFLDSWLAHKQALKAGIEIINNQIIAIAVDESYTGASGCSIDKLYQFIKELEKNLSISLFDRMRVIYKEGNSFLNISITEMQQLIKEKKITAETIVCNSTINSLGELKNNFEIPLEKTWMNRYLASAPV